MNKLKLTKSNFVLYMTAILVTIAFVVETVIVTSFLGGVIALVLVVASAFIISFYGEDLVGLLEKLFHKQLSE